MKIKANTFLLNALAAASLLACTTTYADHQGGKSATGFQDYAAVTHVEPIYKTVTNRIPEQHCWTETRYRPISNTNTNRSYTPTIVGGLVGGALGNELGHSKRNKQVGAVLGGILGASVGTDLYKRQRTQNRPQQQSYNERVCETQYHTQHEEKLTGYNVSYSYQGHDYKTQMNHNPGSQLKVAVSVKPVF